MRLERQFDSLVSSPFLILTRKYFVIFKGITPGPTSAPSLQSLWYYFQYYDSKLSEHVRECNIHALCCYLYRGLHLLLQCFLQS